MCGKIKPMTQRGIYIGTSGWSYPKGEGTWNGYFYPAEKKLDELAYYSRFFNTVEINSTFYRPPDPRMAQSWARRVPDGFLFTVKLWQKFTHPKMFEKATGDIAAVSQDDVSLFRRGIEPLVEAGKLGALLAQFPPSFTNNIYGKQVLQGLVTHFGSYHLAVELRHKSWSDDPATTQLFRNGRVAWVQIDEPKFNTSLADSVPQTSSDIAYFRFHGRNREMWWKGNVETRYCYLYSADEINQLAEKVKSASEQSRITFAFFNNHWKAFAPRNAVDMMKSLDLPPSVTPLFQLSSPTQESANSATTTPTQNATLL
jgi:uncharacterized protein YecE (DUF72 family)